MLDLSHKTKVKRAAIWWLFFIIGQRSVRYIAILMAVSRG